MRGRYAPSPTGGLHLGNARTALLAWLQARAGGGALVMRVEDLDRPRTVAGATEAILSDLRWLGLDWEEGPDVGGARGPYLQSERTAVYDDAVERLRARGLVYECFCSRGEVHRLASAPHGPADDGPRYPGTCRALSAAQASAGRAKGRRPALRFRAPEGPTRFRDLLAGEVAIDVARTVGDFVVRRADGLYAYQLAVAVDDALMGVTDVLRGDDLLASTPRQIALLEALDLPVPKYCHVPLLLGPDGQRLAKRAGDATLGALRARGVPAQRVVAALARSCGLTEADAIDAASLVATFDPGRIRRTPGPWVDPAGV